MKFWEQIIILVKVFEMSDIPQIETDTTNPMTLRIAALTLSGVVGAFVSYWVSYGVHSFFDFISLQFAHSDLSWILSILIGIIFGMGSAYWVNLELSRFIES